MLSIALDLRTKGIIAGSVLPSATDTRMLRQEALDGGNALQFQDPPQTPEQVAKAMMKVLDKQKIEAYPRVSESWLVKTAMLMPNALPRLMPLFYGKGERGMKKYLDDLRSRGLIETVDGVERLTRALASGRQPCPPAPPGARERPKSRSIRVAAGETRCERAPPWGESPVTLARCGSTDAHEPDISAA